MHTVLSPSAASYSQVVLPVEPSTPDSGDRSCGIVTIQNETFTPKGLRSTPPSITDGMTEEIAIPIAIAYNKSEHARQKRRWAVVSTTGRVVILCGVDPDTRPTDPSAFPPAVTAGLTLQEATARADEENSPRFQHARVPRQWSIPLRPLSHERFW